MPRGNQSEPLVGRVRELDLARTLLESAQAGRPQTLLLRGEAGIGKSHLARAIAAEAASLGAVVLWGAGQEDLSLPYLVLRSALNPLGSERLHALAVPEHPSEGSSPAAAWADIADLLLDTAARTPLVLVIDDLHWTDGASQALLLHLLAVLDHAATTRSVQLLAVVAVRTPLEDDRTLHTLSRLQREPHAVVVELTGLEPSDVRELLRAVGPAAPWSGLTRRIVESTAGNPYLAQSILRRGLDEGRITVVDGSMVVSPDDPLVVDVEELDRSVLRRLAQLSPAGQELLTLAAFLGGGAPLTELAELAGRPPDEVMDLVDEAIDAGFLREAGSRVEFSHPQVRHVLFNSPRRRARQQVHLRLADGIEARDGQRSASAISHHLARADDLVEPDRLVRWSTLAARQALAAGAWSDAAVAAEQALGAGRELSWDARADLHLLITEAASHDFDLRAATRHGVAAIELAEAHDDPVRWGHGLLHLARTLVTNSGDTTTTEDLTDRIRDFLGLHPEVDPALRAQLLGLASEIWGAASRIDDALEAATAARQLLTLDTDPMIATSVLVADGMAQWARLELTEARHAYELALSLAPEDRSAKPRQYAAVRLNLVRHLSGDVERAATSAGDTLDWMAEQQSWAEHSLAAAAAASTALARGHLDEVERWVTVSERSFSRSSYLWARLVALPAVALSRVLRGDGTGAREAIGVMAGSPGTSARYGLAIDALLGDVERVRAAVHARPWRRPPVVATLNDLPMLVLQAEVASAIGHAEMAHDALDALEGAHRGGVVLSQGWVGLISRLVADCHLAAEDLERGGEWLEVAAAESRAHGLRIEEGRVALSQARLATATGSPERETLASRASQLLDVAGALPLAAAARRLGRIADEAAGPARRALLFTDLIDSTDLNVRVGDTAFLDLVREHDAVVRSCLRRHSGVEFKHTGDGIAAWFAEAIDACRCGVAIGRELERVSILHPSLPFRVRTGISVGEPLGHAGDLFGLSVVRAARLCALAGDREVLVSQEVVDAARPRGARFVRRGLHHLKGFPEPDEVHAVAAFDTQAPSER